MIGFKEVCLVDKNNNKVAEGILTADRVCTGSCCKSYEEFGAELPQEVCNGDLDLSEFILPPLTPSNWRRLYDESDKTFDKLVTELERVDSDILAEYRGNPLPRLQLVRIK